MTSAPAVREFEILERGSTRDLILDYFRSGLRNRVNPETGELFSEDEIAAATAPGTRWYRQAQATDDWAQGEQRRALWLNDQLRVDRACSQWLAEYHAPIWDPDGKLPATPGSGTVRVPGAGDTVIVGSTVVPDETVHWGRTAKGVRVQVLIGGSIPSSGNPYLDVQMVAMYPGSHTNLEPGEIITWAQKDPGMGPQATVLTRWTGGTDVETDAERASRMGANQRHRPGAGNSSQQRNWVRRASNAIEDAFVYPCAFGDGSTLICVTQKRGATDTGPYAREPSPAVLAAARNYITPPNSPVNPTPPSIIVVKPRRCNTYLGVRLSLQRGSATGWVDLSPFPNCYASAYTGTPYITAVGSNTATLQAPYDSALPGGVASLSGDKCPRMMIWDETQSSWIEITNITQVAYASGVLYTITFSSLPACVQVGRVVSPLTLLHPSIAQTFRDYIDERGPNELLASTDINYARNRRFPELREIRPYRVGTDIAVRVVEDLAGAASDGDMPYKAEQLDVQSSPPAPSMHYLWSVGIYPM